MIIFKISLLYPTLPGVTKITAQAFDGTCPLYHTAQTQPVQNNRGARSGVGGVVVRVVGVMHLWASPVCSLNGCMYWACCFSLLIYSYLTPN